MLHNVDISPATISKMFILSLTWQHNDVNIDLTLWFCSFVLLAGLPTPPTNTSEILYKFVLFSRQKAPHSAPSDRQILVRGICRQGISKARCKKRLHSLNEQKSWSGTSAIL